MASVKAYLRPEVKRDGTSALTLRITKDRKTTNLYLNFSIKPEDWDADSQVVKKSNPNHKRLNLLITQKKAEVLEAALELQTSKRSATARSVKEKVQPKAGSTFKPQAQAYLDRLKDSGKYNRYTADKPRVNHFLKFLPGGDIDFSEITMGLLERFKVHLKATYNLGERSIMNHLVLVRSVFSQAIKEQVADPKYYPFGKGKISIKFPESTKVGISNEDVKRLEDVDLPNDSHNHARNLWLISYYFGGMRISDVLRLKWTDFADMRLHYTMGKNNKTGSIKVVDKAFQLLDKYAKFKENDADLVFEDLKVLPNLENDFEVQRKIAFATSRYDKFLREHVAPAAGIKGRLTMHIARHTFATNAGDIVPIQLLQKIYRHSNITTTIAYQANFINKDTDEALDAVLRP